MFGMIFRFIFSVPYILEEVTAFVVDHTLFKSKRFEAWIYRKSFDRLNAIDREREVQ